VTDEAVDVVDKWFAKQKKTGYPIVIDHGGLEQALGVPHFPYSGVIDADGILSYAGDSPEGALKAAGKEAKSGSIWPKKLANTVALVRSGKLGEAWADLQALKASGGFDDKEQKAFDKFSSFVSDNAASQVKAASDLFGKDMAYAAMKRAEPIANAKPPLPASADAQKLVGDIKAMPTYDIEVKGGELYDAAVAKEEAKDYLGAVKGFQDASKKSEGSKISKVALDRAKDLVGRGMPGYESACEKCMNGKRACSKHAKAVKL
jgi:hypothetical protein